VTKALTACAALPIPSLDVVSFGTSVVVVMHVLEHRVKGWNFCHFVPLFFERYPEISTKDL
jgi:hypothetical protein